MQDKMVFLFNRQELENLKCILGSVINFMKYGINFYKENKLDLVVLIISIMALCLSGAMCWQAIFH
jgi:hypothetical protein